MSLDINAIADDLRGTCLCLSDVLAQQGDYSMSTAQCEELDQIVMLCDQCGWWDDADQFSGDDQICDECHGGD